MLVSGQSIYIGSSAITAVYQGDDLVWSGGTPVTGETYYYYYQSETGMSVAEAIEAFSTDKQRGPGISSGTQFSFHISSARDKVKGYFVGLAVPSTKEFTKMMQKPPGQGAVDVTALFKDTTQVRLDNRQYTLYYHWAIWMEAEMTGYTEPCFCYLASTATTTSDAIADFCNNRKNGEFVSGNTHFRFSTTADTQSIVFALPSTRTVTSVYRNNPNYPITITDTTVRIINDIEYIVYAALFSPPFASNWGIGIETQ